MNNKVKSMKKKCDVIANHLLNMATEFKALGYSLEQHKLEPKELEKFKVILDNKIVKVEEFMK